MHAGFFLFTIHFFVFQFICSIVALLLHYFYSAVFVWMLVEGLLLYSKVVQVFGSEKSRITYYYAFGWGKRFNAPLNVVYAFKIYDMVGIIRYTKHISI